VGASWAARQVGRGGGGARGSDGLRGGGGRAERREGGEGAGLKGGRRDFPFSNFFLFSYYLFCL
jgi:hypothetical protein